MKTTTGQKNKPYKPPHKPSPPPLNNKSTRGNFRKILAGFWKGLLGFGGVLGLGAAIYFYLPKIDILLPSYYIDPSSPFKAPFRIINQSIFSVYQIHPLCFLRDYKSNKSRIYTVKYKNYCPPIPELLSLESSSIYCAFPLIKIIDDFIIYADVELCLDYRPSFYPLLRNKCFRFETVSSYTGQLMWRHKALSEK
jgi:hypothetical protein